MTPYSQRNLFWRWTKLGFSNLTIGEYGCTLTNLGMIHNVNPNEMNNLLKGGGAFSNGSLINWDKLHAAVPAFQFISRVRTYDNSAVLDAIKKYGFCLVNVNAGPIGNPRGDHWVIFKGSKLLIDPWDGKEKATALYSGMNGKGLLGYCVLSHS